MAPGESYNQSLAKEKEIYENNANVHDLPGIFHYWSNRHIRPKLLPYGFGSSNEMFLKFLDRRCSDTPEQRFVSIGSGNCDLEIGLAQGLVSNGRGSFIIDCLDINPAMLERGGIAARESGVAGRLNFVEGDFNSWRPAHEYDAVIANQSLHHVVELENLFDQVKRVLRPGGLFLVSDMIGRNGHQRWPEALDIVHEFWRKLPPSYRINPEFKRYEDLYQDYDCSCEGFEGVRSQDILRLLIDRFHFHLFIPFGNVIDPFVDRIFGHHFDAQAEWDRSFIDQVHQRDEIELASGRLTPTHVLAVLQNEPSPHPLPVSPDSCVRNPDKAYRSVIHPQESPVWPQREWEITCQRIAKYHADLQNEFEKRTFWALGLDEELKQTTAQLAEAEAKLRSPFRYAVHTLKRALRRL